MNLLIVGCGRIGALIATSMNRLGHAVSVVDRDPASFEALDETFRGLTLVGNPIDQDFLRRAGIEGCDAVAAVTASDNVNAMVSQIARELFHIERVLTRISDPVREPVFAQFGLHIICPTALAADSAIAALTERDLVRYADFGGRAMSLSAVAPPPDALGGPVSSLRLAPGELLTAVLHPDGRLELATCPEGLLLADGDRLVIARLLLSEVEE
ncbi:MAG: TrkA family potassium uptake protein [Oscillospiraceae bacterium]